MKVIAALLPPTERTEQDRVQGLVAEFARGLPKLQTQAGAFGRCKMASYELCMYLRRRGIRARMVHVQGIRAGVYPTAHATWMAKPRARWSHYVCKVGHLVIDMTARQFDTSLPVPHYQSLHGLRQQWDTVESDKFLNTWITDVLQHKDAS